jgi:hypothetical protein
MDIKERVEEFKARERQRDYEWRKQMCEQEEESARRRREFETYILPMLFQASKSDYERWLKGFLAKSNTPTHNYDYNFPARSFYVAAANFEIIPLYGSQSINVIVPQGVQVDTSRGLGHNNLYFMKDFTASNGWIPIYSDLEF